MLPHPQPRTRRWRYTLQVTPPAASAPSPAGPWSALMTASTGSLWVHPAALNWPAAVGASPPLSADAGAEPMPRHPPAGVRSCPGVGRQPLAGLLAARWAGAPVRAALAASTTTGTVPVPAQGAGPPRELGRVHLVVPVRQESIAWLDEVAHVTRLDPTAGGTAGTIGGPAGAGPDADPEAGRWPADRRHCGSCRRRRSA